MNTEGYTYTVSGLRVVRELPPPDWTPFTTVAAGMEHAERAVDFAQVDVRGDVSTDNPPVECIDLALCCVHVGDVPIVGELARAVDAFTAEHRRVAEHVARQWPVEVYTVCGLNWRNFRTVSYVLEARSWQLAWDDAVREARAEGIEFLTGRIHPGEELPIEGFLYADRLATNDAEMRDVVDGWGQEWRGR